MNDVDEELQKRYAEINRFLEALAWANECGLKMEFMDSFLQDYEQTKSIPSAVWFAECEWDL
jgi:enoyl-[acyl-carrier-protein] reductase (NADH)